MCALLERGIRKRTSQVRWRNRGPCAPSATTSRKPESALNATQCLKGRSSLPGWRSVPWQRQPQNWSCRIRSGVRVPDPIASPDWGQHPNCGRRYREQMEQERDRVGPADGESAPTPEGPPAGWYPDLHDGAADRWWSGKEWTELRQRRTKPGIQTESTAAPSAASPHSLSVVSANTTRDLRIRIPAQSLIEQVIRLSNAAGPQPAGANPQILPPEAESWYTGAVGERRVAALLSQLGPEWTVLHSVPVGTKGSDIDHVLVGPAGVYTINTKHHEGKTAWVAGHGMMIDGQKVHHLGNMAAEVRRAKRVLTKASGLTVEAAGLIVLVGVKSLTMPSKPNGDDVVLGVVRDRDLLATLQSRRIYSDAQVQRIADAAARPETWSSVPLASADTAALLAEFDQIEKGTTLRSSAAVGERRRQHSVAAPRPRSRTASRPNFGRRRRRKPSALESVLQAGGFLLMAVIAYAMLGHH